jgi:hypothetical protein
MSYNVDQLQSVADCDLLLEDANFEHSELEFRKTSRQRAFNNMSSGSAGIDAEILGVTSEVAGYEAALAIMPEGAAKKAMNIKYQNALHRKFLLETRRDKSGVIAQLFSEYGLASIDVELAENAVFIDAINTRKAQL